MLAGITADRVACCGIKLTDTDIPGGTNGVHAGQAGQPVPAWFRNLARFEIR